MPDLSIMRFRHWHQAGRPKFLHYGEHGPVQLKLIELGKSKGKPVTAREQSPFALGSTKDKNKRLELQELNS